jgi:methylase of polypeptide subunit release factors
MTLYVKGRKLELLYCEEIQPTIYSLFMANLLDFRESDVSGCDLGTGSGILAIVLAQLNMQKVIAIDHSAFACELAEENVRRHGVADRVEVVHAEFTDLSPFSFDLAVCNPPTMPSVDDTPGFASGGGDPLGVVETIAAGLGVWLRPQGRAQVALSSLVSPEALNVFEQAGFAGIPEASLPTPFRPFYMKAYSDQEIDSFLGSGRALRNDPRDFQALSEIVTIYSLRRLQRS